MSGKIMKHGAKPSKYRQNNLANNLNECPGTVIP